MIEVPYKRTKHGITLKLPPHTAQEGLPATIDGKTARVRVAQWSTWVRNAKVNAGLEFLCQTMADPVQLPPELLPERRAA